MRSITTESGRALGPNGIPTPAHSDLERPKGFRAFGCQLDEADVRSAVLNAMEAKDALTVAYRLLRTDTVLGIAAETAGKTVSRLLDSLNARLTS